MLGKVWGVAKDMMQYLDLDEDGACTIAPLNQEKDIFRSVLAMEAEFYKQYGVKSSIVFDLFSIKIAFFFCYGILFCI